MIKFSGYGHSPLGLAVEDTAILVDPCFTGSPATSTTPEVSRLAHDVVAGKRMKSARLRIEITFFLPGKASPSTL